MSTYPGGKSGAGVYQTLINQMPPHRVYVEPFLGGGAIMRLKRPAEVENIGVDLDMQVIQDFQAPRAPIPYPRGKFYCLDGIELMQHLGKYLAPGPIHPKNDVMIYCDPPYLMGTRSSQRQLYRYEMEDDDHRRLLDTILNLNYMVMISGYANEMYDQALAGWRRLTYPAMTRGGSLAEEVIWMNYPEPWELHDYSFIGADFRERERIKRKIKRWKGKLSRMEQMERAALMLAINEVRYSDAPATSPEPAILAPVEVKE